MVDGGSVVGWVFGGGGDRGGGCGLSLEAQTNETQHHGEEECKRIT